MKDERIEAGKNRYAARGFFIWYILLSISLAYRQFILKQQPRDYWDILVIFVIGTLYVSIAYSAQGLFAHEFKRLWLSVGIGAVASVLTMSFIQSRIHSVANVGAYLIGACAGVGLVIVIAYLLNRHWKRKEGIEENK